MTRPCMACDGTGGACAQCCHPALDHDDYGCYWSYNAEGRLSPAGEEFDYCGCEQPVSDCGACGGSGRISERIPARDAELDAETLVLESRRWALGQDSASYVRSAQGSGTCLLDELEIGLAVNGDLPASLASGAARAAFRAVPGLRG